MTKACSLEGCHRKHYGKGFCNPHYQQSRKGLPLTSIWEKNPLGHRDAEGRKLCGGCKTRKFEQEFGANGSMPDGLANFCKKCAYSAGMYSKYRIRAEEYEAMLVAQGGTCAICDRVNSDGRALAVDHDHACCPGVRSCGKCVRKLLCTECNTGIGSLGDSVSRLRKAAEYLEGHSA